MEQFPMIILLIGLIVSIITIRHPKYRSLTLIGSGALPCVLYIISPDLWVLELIVFVGAYVAEYWKIRRSN